jgi:hypothetical protein
MNLSVLEKPMLTRGCLASLAFAGLICLPGFPAHVFGAEQKAEQIIEKRKNPHADMLMSCAKACGDCQQACDSCSAHCLMLVADGKAQHIKTMQLCNDCAVLCASSAQIVARHGPLMNVICNACADACNQCASSCETFKDDSHMKHCAEECRRCEKACRTMTGQAKAQSRQSR